MTGFMKINTLQILSAIAGLALVIGIGWSVITVRQAPDLAKSLKGRVAVLVELQAMRQERERYAAAVQAYEALSNTAPTALAGLAAAVTNATPEIRELESRPLDRGWTLTRAEVIFTEINLDQLPAFLRSAESQRPPWRLAECAIASSTKTDGFGRVVLIMEAVGKERK
jgi:hypothetical protein